MREAAFATRDRAPLRNVAGASGSGDGAERVPLRGDDLGEDGAHEARDHDERDRADDERHDLHDDGHDGADVQRDEPSSSELDPQPTEDARDALSQAVLGEPPASGTTPRAPKATLLMPDQVATIRLWPGVSPPAKDAEFLADLYRSVLFLHAKGYVQPASGQEGEAMWDRYVDTLEPTLTEEQMDELSEVSHEWHPQVRGLLGAAFQPPPPPKVSYSQGFLIGCIGFFLGALMAYNGYKAKEKRALAQAQASAILPPAYHLPYNPAEHGSVDTYRLAFGHLPPPPTVADPERVGLDRQAAILAPAPWQPQDGMTSEQGAAYERKRRGL